MTYVAGKWHSRISVTRRWTASNSVTTDAATGRLWRDVSCRYLQSEDITPGHLWRQEATGCLARGCRPYNVFGERISPPDVCSNTIGYCLQIYATKEAVLWVSLVRGFRSRSSVVTRDPPDIFYKRISPRAFVATIWHLGRLAGRDTLSGRVCD